MSDTKKFCWFFFLLFYYKRITDWTFIVSSVAIILCIFFFLLFLWIDKRYMYYRCFKSSKFFLLFFSQTTNNLVFFNSENTNATHTHVSNEFMVLFIMLVQWSTCLFSMVFVKKRNSALKCVVSVCVCVSWMCFARYRKHWYLSTDCRYFISLLIIGFARQIS